jgi:hypothetical protein
MFIDEAEHIGRRQLTACFTWHVDRPEITAHFLRGPKLVPGILITEQVAQSALLLAIIEGYHTSGKPLMLGQFRCEIMRPAQVPCTVVADTEVDAVVVGKIGFRAKCSVNGDLVAKVRGIAAAMPTAFCSA